MLTLEEIYQRDPAQRDIDKDAGWGAQEMLTRTELTADYRLLEEQIKLLNG